MFEITRLEVFCDFRMFEITRLEVFCDWEKSYNKLSYSFSAVVNCNSGIESIDIFFHMLYLVRLILEELSNNLALQ